MKISQARFLPALLLGGTLLAGCSHQQTRDTSPPTRSTTTTRARVASAAPSRHSSSHTAAASTPADETTSTVEDPSAKTGIPACDDYLSSYIACHRAAHIFAPGQLPSRYQAMRQSLLRDSKDPDVRPELAVRCNSLATQLREALHGKSCAVEPAASSSTP